MKNKYLLIILSFILLNQKLSAQDEAAKLTIPSTPAFSILNFEPSAVMRPTTNKDLATDILNSFDKDGKLLVNLGLEVSPYWLQSRPTLTREKYLNPKIGQTFLQSFSLSGATVKDSASGDNKFGVGFRFKILNGSPVDDLKQAEEDLRQEETIIADIVATQSFVGAAIHTKKQAIDFIIKTMSEQNYSSDDIIKFRNDANIITTDYSDSDADIKLFLEKLYTNRVDANGESLKRVVDLTYQRKGLILELAGASGFNASDKNSLERAGVWINASNYISPADLFTLTGRYMFQNKDSSLSNIDIGLAYLKETGKYNISVEGMMRWYRADIPDLDINSQPIKRVEKKFTYRVAIQGSYMLRNDISLNISFGKDFDSPFISGSGFFSILGLNYSIFNKEKVDLK